MDESIRLQSQQALQADTLNDDDFYVIDTTTKSIVSTATGRGREPTALPGQLVLRGTRAKGLIFQRTDIDVPMLKALGSSM
jgi:hypothetical protein